MKEHRRRDARGRQIRVYIGLLVVLSDSARRGGGLPGKVDLNMTKLSVQLVTVGDT